MTSTAQRAAGVSLIAAPALLTLANAIDPGSSDKAAARLPEIAASQGRYVATFCLMLVAIWAYVPGLLGLWRLFEGPRLTAGQIGAGLLTIGMVTTFTFVAFGVYEYEAATSGLDPGQMAKLVDDAEASALGIPLLIVFLLGVVVGSLIVAWQLWRQRLVPAWSPALIVVGTLLNFGADTAAMSAIAFGLQAVGFGRVGLRLLGARWATLGKWEDGSARAGALS